MSSGTAFQIVDFDSDTEQCDDTCDFTCSDDSCDDSDDDDEEDEEDDEEEERRDILRNTLLFSIIAVVFIQFVAPQIPIFINGLTFPRFML